MPRYPEEIIPGVQLDVYPDLDRAIEYSVYNSRAWTYDPYSSACNRDLAKWLRLGFKRKFYLKELSTLSITKSISVAGLEPSMNISIRGWKTTRAI